MRAEEDFLADVCWTRIGGRPRVAFLVGYLCDDPDRVRELVGGLQE